MENISVYERQVMGEQKKKKTIVLLVL